MLFKFALAAAVLFLIWKVTKMSEASDNLSREVAETREAVNALTGRYQTKINDMQVEIDSLNAALEAGDTTAAQAAADALDALQTEMAGLGGTAAPADDGVVLSEDPVEEDPTAQV